MRHTKSAKKLLHLRYKDADHRSWIGKRNYEAVVQAIVRDRGVERVQALGIQLEGHDLIQIGSSTSRKPLDCDGYLLTRHGDIDALADVLRQLKHELDLDLDIQVIPPKKWQEGLAAELLA